MHNTFDKLFKDSVMLRFFLKCFLKKTLIFTNAEVIWFKQYNTNYFILKHLYNLKYLFSTLVYFKMYSISVM